jgi:CheY-like chemotaxis protein
MRVLIVDDQPEVTESLCTLVRDLGHQARGALTGFEAMDVFQPGRYDVVVIDIVMPEMNGLEVIRRVRLLDREARIVAMTGTGLDFSEVLGEAGIRVAHKPFANLEQVADLLGVSSAPATNDDTDLR